MVWFLIAVLFALVVVESYLLYRLVLPLMAVEDHLSEAIDVHNRSIATMTALLELPMFYDSPQVLQAATAALEDVKVCRMATVQVAEDFLRLSKNKYVLQESE